MPEEYSRQTSITVNRRTLLKGISTGAVGGLAGCIGGPNPGSTSDDGAAGVEKLGLEAVYAEVQEGNTTYEEPEVQVWNGGRDIEAVCVLPDGTDRPEPFEETRYCTEVDWEEADRMPEDKYTFTYDVSGPGQYDVHVWVDDDSPDTVDVQGARRAQGRVQFDGERGEVLDKLSWADG